jgi:hypothetical protein
MKTIKCTWAHHLEERPPVQWTVESVIPHRTVGMLVGHTQNLKSYLALDIACHVATGRHWNGHPVQQGTVFYLAAEAQEAMMDRLEAWEADRKLKVPHFCFCTTPVTLAEDIAVDDLIEEIVRQCQREGVAVPALIVIDTYHRCMSGQDENHAGQAAKALNNLERLKDQFGCTVLLIHHPPRTQNHPRGSSAIECDLDFWYFVSYNRATEVVTMKKEKLRCDLGEVAQYLKAVPVQVGEDKTNLVLHAHRPTKEDLAGDPSKEGGSQSPTPDEARLQTLREGIRDDVFTLDAACTLLPGCGKSTVQRTLRHKSVEKLTHGKYRFRGSGEESE